MGSASGRFVWFDLMTTDVEAARSFYEDVVGWGTVPWSGGEYLLWKAGAEEVGGLMTLPPEAARSGSPPQWLAYIDVDDVDATVHKAQSLGGKVHVPPRDIPGVGRFAVLEDPQGAGFAVFKAAEQWGEIDARKQGRFGWSELNTTDFRSAWQFYSSLFGWKHTSSMDMGPEYGEYFMFGADEKEAFGGMSDTAGRMGAPPHWLHYVNVENADEAVRKVVEKGGKSLNGPMDVPGGGRIAQVQDPQGAMFAVLSTAASGQQQ